jgi:hypothetical protein
MVMNCPSTPFRKEYNIALPAPSLFRSKHHIAPLILSSQCIDILEHGIDYPCREWNITAVSFPAFWWQDMNIHVPSFFPVLILYTRSFMYTAQISTQSLIREFIKGGGSRRVLSGLW